MSLLSVISDKKQISEKDLEVLLIDFLKYGEPRLSFIDKGWHCGIKMRIMSQGSTFDVKSEFGMKTPIDAALQCRKRMLEALNNIK